MYATLFTMLVAGLLAGRPVPHLGADEAVDGGRGAVVTTLFITS